MPLVYLDKVEYMDLIKLSLTEVKVTGCVGSCNEACINYFRGGPLEILGGGGGQFRKNRAKPVSSLEKKTRRTSRRKKYIAS